MQLRLERNESQTLYCDPTVIKEPSPSNKLKRGAHSLYQIRLVITCIKKSGASDWLKTSAFFV